MGATPAKVCITGGAGFIGSKLARHWYGLGAQVVVVDNLSVGLKGSVPAGVELVVCDVLDTDRVAEAMRGAELVYHMAARVAIRSSFEFVVADTMVNVSGTASVLRAAQLAGTVRKFVFTSSMAVYADSAPGTTMSETHLTKPISPYGISKLSAESLVLQLCFHAGMESVVLRLFNTYGLGQALSPYVGAVTIFCNRLVAGEAPTIYGDGMQCRDFVHVDDVVQALSKAGVSSLDGEILNVGTGVATTVTGVVAALQDALDVHVQPRYVDALPGELRSAVACIDKAASMLGYQPVHQFATAVGPVAREIAQYATMGAR